VQIEVLCTGDELLVGLTTDTNSPYFMERLFALGEKVARAQTVGDVRMEIIEAIKTTSARADAVLVSGGLGPTADDLTAECAAAAAGVPLVEHRPTLEFIKARFAKLGIAFSQNNARQALVPQGAEVVRNPVGSAPMFIQRLGRCTLFYLPGVPREYRALVDSEVLPRLSQMISLQPNRIYRASRLLKTVGLPESHLDALVAPLSREHSKVTFGFRTHAPENHLKLLAEDSSQGGADSALASAERACREVLGAWVFGADKESFSSAIASAMRQCGGTLAIAESCTGGKAADLITQEAGASDFFLGSAVTYQDALKERWAAVDRGLLSRYGAVSREVALSMAEGIRQQTGATYGLSITGFAGPGGGDVNNPVGTVYYAMAGFKSPECERRVFLGERERVRQFAAYAMLDFLRRRVLGLESRR